jgi:photosystem II stability/assembly factor-like uncharacterized protein
VAHFSTGVDGSGRFAGLFGLTRPSLHPLNFCELPTLLLSSRPGVALTGSGKIYRTTDGANSWTDVFSAGRPLNKTAFLDGIHGAAVGAAGAFLTTSDGGVTWTAKPLALPGAPNLIDVSCADALTCVMATGSNQLVRTTDGGSTGTLVAPAQTAIFAAGFASATRVAALGASGTTAISSDGAATFAPVGGTLPGSYSAMVAGPAGVAFAPGAKGSLAKTTDAGATWVRGNVSTPNDVVDVSFPTATSGFALDSSGGLFRTADGGGAYTTSWRLSKGGNTFVAQWAGNFNNAGRGTKPLTVKVG